MLDYLRKLKDFEMDLIPLIKSHDLEVTCGDIPAHILASAAKNGIIDLYDSWTKLKDHYGMEFLPGSKWPSFTVQMDFKGPDSDAE